MFGRNQEEGEVPSMSSQFDACSAGALQFVPAEGDYISNSGVMNVDVPYNITGMFRQEVQNLVIAEAQQYVGSLDKWNNVMIVLPKEVDFDGVNAYALGKGWLTVYKNRSGQWLGIQMYVRYSCCVLDTDIC